MTFPRTTLERWLDDVSRPFPPDTARRIRRELEDHVLTHAEALRDAGHPDPESAALAALGSPCAVQRALMQEYFTLEEEEQLWRTTAYRQARTRSGLETGFMLAVPLIASVFPGLFSFPWAAYAAYAISLLLSSILEGWIPRRFPPRSARVVLVVVRLVMAATLALCLYGLWHGNESDFWFELTPLLIGSGIVTFFYLRPLWSLLPKALRGAR